MALSKRALLSFALATMLVTGQAHKAIIDDDVVADASQYEELEEQALHTKAHVESQAQKAAKDPKFFEKLEGLNKHSEKDVKFYVANYSIEAAFFGFFGICLLVLWIGTGQNNAIALDWHLKALPSIKDNFAYVGLFDGIENMDLEQTSYSEFNFYASGRENTFYSLFKLDLVKRHCLFSKLITDRIYAPRDILTVDIPLRFAGNYSSVSPLPMEFFLCLKSQVKTAFSNNEHFNQFLTQVKSANLPIPKPVSEGQNRRARQPDHFVVLGENDEIADKVIDKNMGELFQKYALDTLVDIHVTDQKLFNKYPLFMRTRLLIGETPEDQQRALNFLQVIFLLADRIVKIKLSTAAHGKAERTRKKVDQAKNQEQTDEKEAALLEKKRQEEVKFNAKLKTLPPAEQRKLEEKRRKQDLAQQKKKMMKMVKF